LKKLRDKKAAGEDAVVFIPTYSQLNSGTVFDKWKNYYTLHQMSLFSELHFVWSE